MRVRPLDKLPKLDESADPAGSSKRQIDGGGIQGSFPFLP